MKFSNFTTIIAFLLRSIYGHFDYPGV